MIIACEKCSTQFNLDESMLKREGSKVRCSMCRYIFTAYPHHDEKPQPKEFQTPNSPQIDDKFTIEHNFTVTENLKIDDRQSAIDDDDLKIDDDLFIDDDLKIDNDLTIDDDFSINDNFKTGEIETIYDQKPKHIESTSLQQNDDLDFDFSFDDDMDIDFSSSPKPSSTVHSASTPAPKLDSPTKSTPPSLQMTNSPDIENGLELDLDFSTDDMDFSPAPASKSAPNKPASNITAPSKTPPKPINEPMDLESGLELDLDFSTDDMDFSPAPAPASKSAPNKPAPNNTAPSKTPPKPINEPMDLESGLELDLDFSTDDMDFSPAPAPASKSAPNKPAPNNTAPSKTPPKSINEPMDLESGLELDLDFSTDDHPIESNNANSDDNFSDGLEFEEIEIEDSSEFDLDFGSALDSNTNTAFTKQTEKQQTVRPMESISLMDSDFSTGDDDIEINEIDDSDDDMFDGDYVDESDRITEMGKDSSSKQYHTNKLSLTKSENQQTTLGGQPIRSSNKGSSLLGDKSNLFEDSPLLEKNKRSSIGKFIFIFLVLTAITIAGYAASIIMGIKIPYISDLKIPPISGLKLPYIDKFFSSELEPVKLTPDQKTVSGKFVTNTISGTLFVITGQVINHSKIPCKDIKIQGTLISTAKTRVKDKTVLCGNMISEEQLKTLDMTAINSIFYSSDSNKKFTVEPGQSISFMIVFSDFPQNLENFTVSVTDYKRITKN